MIKLYPPKTVFKKCSFASEQGCTRAKKGLNPECDKHCILNIPRVIAFQKCLKCSKSKICPYPCPRYNCDIFESKRKQNRVGRPSKQHPRNIAIRITTLEFELLKRVRNIETEDKIKEIVNEIITAQKREG